MKLRVWRKTANNPNVSRQIMARMRRKIWIITYFTVIILICFYPICWHQEALSAHSLSCCVVCSLAVAFDLNNFFYPRCKHQLSISLVILFVVNKRKSGWLIPVQKRLKMHKVFARFSLVYFWLAIKSISRK